MKYRLGRKQTVVLILLLIFLSLIISRGWIRNSALPWYANQTVGKQVNAVFDSSFAAINKQFSIIGINLTEADSIDPTCGTGNYHYLRVTVICLKGKSAYSGIDHKPSIPQPLIDSWPIVLRSLDINDSPQSWAVDKSSTNIADPNDELKFKTGGRNEIEFVRQVNKVQCTLDILADPAQASYPSDYHINETCYKNVNFFGGWDCRKDYCQP